MGLSLRELALLSVADLVEIAPEWAGTAAAADVRAATQDDIDALFPS